MSGRAEPVDARVTPARGAFGRHGMALAALAGVFPLSGCDVLRLDQDLCPVDEAPRRSTVLLLDTSDPLAPQHRAELRRLVRDMQVPPEDAREANEAAEPSVFYVAPGEALIVYELGQNLGETEPVLRACNPGGHPDTWRWWEGLFRGEAITKSRWRRFGEIVEEMFDAPGESAPQLRSSIIETLGVIVPRHASSSRVSRQSANRTHLILYSDLLQHSDALSHYGDYPAPEEIQEVLKTSLSGVDVSLFRLERAEYARWQTVDHYYWWTSLVMEFDGNVVWQESM